jgi:hypothetical protein
MWCADARGVEDLLHPLLVTEGNGLLDRHAGNAERFANARGQHHGRLPQRRNVIDVDAGRALHDLVDDRVLVREGRYLPVRREVITGHVREA